ncbi:MAG TPA: M15 family metallopeptidase [Candidatus Babeliales bacterium]|nr:M15 family metallopeptidase [Candidatus Babeliales bacterium]
MKFTRVVVSMMLSGLFIGIVADEQSMWRIECPIQEPTAQLIRKHSWKPGCPVAFEDLALVTLPYWGYDDQPHTGQMVVHRKVAQEVVEVFCALFEHKFPIERMRLIDEYNADDNLSMNDNNSSAFCAREITNKPGQWSLHSYGIAIDVNPLINPYVNKSLVLPEAGKAYLDRTIGCKGIITDAVDNVCYQAFVTRGWDWGGSWMPIKGYVDYQHFAKDPSVVS